MTFKTAANAATRRYRLSTLTSVDVVAKVPVGTIAKRVRRHAGRGRVHLPARRWRALPRVTMQSCTTCFRAGRQPFVRHTATLPARTAGQPCCSSPMNAVGAGQYGWYQIGGAGDRQRYAACRQRLLRRLHGYRNGFAASATRARRRATKCLGARLSSAVNVPSCEQIVRDAESSVRAGPDHVIPLYGGLAAPWNLRGSVNALALPLLNTKAT
jgi:hypothetical protein